MSQRTVTKRDGTREAQSMERVRSAIARALESTGENELLVESLCAVVDSRLDEKDEWHVEEVQDVVESALMAAGLSKTAKAFIVYRQRRAELRAKGLAPDRAAVADYTHASKYARYDPRLGRREVWEETVARVEAMHLSRFAREDDTRPDLESMRDEIVEAFDAVRRREVVPSMRSMQFGGPAMEVNNARLYNCCFSLCDRPRFFAELFWLLLSGCGAGYSVQRRHVSRLPVLQKIDRATVVTLSVDDSIEGWARALHALVQSYMGGSAAGTYVEFNYRKIRPEGSPLVTSGGKAPGHVPLKEMLEDVRRRLDLAAGRRLRPIEAHDIACIVSDAVLSGGVRRSSLIALFSPDDHEMMEAKTGEWWRENPHRARANNSAAFLKDYVDESQFREIFRMAREFGEPGFVLLADLDYGINPCGEIGLNPVCRETGETGWAFCNLTDINGATCETAEELIRRAILAARIGTLQAAYCDFPFLTEASRRIAEREALLGVGITGIMDSPVARDPEAQRAAARAAAVENARVAELIGIGVASRVTCVKPSGTGSLVLGCVGSGIHPHHARRYFRRILANPNEEAFRTFREANPHMCYPVGGESRDWIVMFPVQAPEEARVVEDFTATEFMESVFSTYENWVSPGTVDPSRSPGLTHNVSATVVVREGEWDAAEECAWKNRHRISAMTFLPLEADTKYANAPRQAVRTEEDESKWTRLIRDYRPVDYSKVRSDGDPMSVSACEGQKCEVTL